MTLLVKSSHQLIIHITLFPGNLGNALSRNCVDQEILRMSLCDYPDSVFCDVRTVSFMIENIQFLTTDIRCDFNIHGIKYF